MAISEKDRRPPLTRTAKGEKATSGFEPLSGASNVSMRDLAEALDTLRELVREIRNDNG